MSKSIRLTGFGNYPVQDCQLVRPHRYQDLRVTGQWAIARGQGGSYGDAALNANGQVIVTSQINRLLAFDRLKGIITAEAGITLAEMLKVIVPAGWFLPVTPGTQYVSLGGCVAANVHGKNHHRNGAFSQYVRWFELILAKSERKLCSATENASLFWATVAGMGLTGMIGVVSLQLVPIATSQMAVTHYPTKNLLETMTYLSEAEFDDHYSVAWIDATAKALNAGRGIVMTGHHASLSDLPDRLQHTPLANAPRKQWRLPLVAACRLLNRASVRLFNHWYYQRQQGQRETHLCHYQQFFYPLDAVIGWNHWYGKKGFLQYQCVLPTAQAAEGFQRILKTLADNHCTVFLAVLKRFGASDRGLLSFPMPGFTLALDIPLENDRLFQTLDQLDDIVIEHQGRVYLAKDARLTPQAFRKMYPHYPQWSAIKSDIDPENIFDSALAQRLQISSVK